MSLNPTLDDIWKLFQETDRLFRETDKKLDKLDELLNSQWGRLIESLVDGALVPLLMNQQ